MSGCSGGAGGDGGTGSGGLGLGFGVSESPLISAFMCFVSRLRHTVRQASGTPFRATVFVLDLSKLSQEALGF
jgi:hypothetical protein